MPHATQIINVGEREKRCLFFKEEPSSFQQIRYNKIQSKAFACVSMLVLPMEKWQRAPRTIIM